MSDRIAVMSKGKIQQLGAPLDIYERPVNRFVADFIGDANIVAAELRRHDGEQAAVTLGGIVLVLPHNGAADGKVELAIRPEALQVILGTAGTNAIEGKVIAAAYLGTRVEYRLATAIGELFAIDRDVARPLASGSAVSVRFASTGITVIPA
jgi:iron(III) transport system ATP-binding protein